MPQLRKSGAIVAIVFVSLALSACAGVFDAKYPIAKEIPASQSLIRFNDPLLANARQLHVSYLGGYEHVEYARYETNDLVMEAVYDVALGISYVLEYDYWMSRMANTWNVNRGKDLSWGTERHVTAWHGNIDYQPYRIVGNNRECIAFSSEWDHQPRDSFDRPSRVFFGYVCPKLGKSLTVASVAALLKSVTFSREPVEHLVPVDGRASIDPAAMAAAEGSPGSDTGNAKFPFNFGRAYWEGDGGSFSH